MQEFFYYLHVLDSSFLTCAAHAEEPLPALEGSFIIFLECESCIFLCAVLMVAVKNVGRILKSHVGVVGPVPSRFWSVCGMIAENLRFVLGG